MLAQACLEVCFFHGQFLFGVMVARIARSVDQLTVKKKCAYRKSEKRCTVDLREAGSPYSPLVHSERASSPNVLQVGVPQLVLEGS